MADVTSNSTYTLAVQGNLRRWTIDISSADGTTSDTVNSRLRRIVSMSGNCRGSTFVVGGLQLSTGTTFAGDFLGIRIAQSSLYIEFPKTIIVEGV